MRDSFEEAKKIKALLTSAGAGEKKYLSDFWREHLAGRTNFPEGEALENFLANDASDGYGNVYGEAMGRKFEELVDTYVPETPIEFLRRFTDPPFGGAVKHRYRGVNSSIIFLNNITTAYRIHRLPLKKGLRVLEIGAGFGAVSYILHQLLDIKKYTILDLPESLYLSYFYLSRNTGKPSVFVSRERTDMGIEFATPEETEKIDKEYDLIINTISMCEMDLDMVETYKKLIKERLSGDGYFFCVNTHNKAGVTRPNQYLIDGMKLYSMESWSRRCHEKFFNKLHYEIVQTRSVGKDITDKVRKGADYYGNLITIGARTPFDESVSLYEEGVKRYRDGKVTEALGYFRVSLSKGLKGFARTAANLILMVNDWKTWMGLRDKKMLEDMFSASPILKKEIEGFMRDPITTIKMRRRLRAWLKREYMDGIEKAEF